MATDDSPPLSLRPFPVADQEPKSLAEFIARVNAQPGGFRALTEDGLRQQIRTREQDATAAVEDEDDEMPDADSNGGDGEDEDEAATDPSLARLELLKNIEVARNSALLTLDFISLLLSKQNPTQAGLTLSQQLREMVGIGTMGADKLGDAMIDESAASAKEQAALGLTLMEINTTRDAARQASKQLRSEIEAESRYWKSVVRIKQAGWAICRVPQQRHMLGVRFGFSEAAPEFRRNGLAPLRRGEKGSVELDLGRLGGVSEAIVVSYYKNGSLVGRSVPRRSALAATDADDSSTLEERVLEARNTIFAQELWHELTREARTLAAYNVRLKDSSLTWDWDASTNITIQLLPLDACSATPDASLRENVAAEATCVLLHLFLSYAHRYNEMIRTRPTPPHMSRARTQTTTYSLLRPIVARSTALAAMRACTRYVGSLTMVFRAAGFPATFTLRTPPLPAGEPNQQPLSAAQSLMRSLLQPYEFVVDVTLLASVSLTIRARTFLLPVTTTHYHVSLPPDSPLRDATCPFADGYLSLGALCEYLDLAATRALLSHALTRLPTPTYPAASPPTPPDSNATSPTDVEWVIGPDAMVLRDNQSNSRELRFCVGNRHLPWGNSGSTLEEKDARLEKQRENVFDDSQPEDEVPPTVRLIAMYVREHKPTVQRWQWTCDGACETRSFDDALDTALAFLSESWSTADDV